MDGVGSRSYPKVASVLVVLNFVFCFIHTEYGLWEGPTTNFQKSKRAISKFQTPERFHKVSSMLRNYNSEVTCEPPCYLVCYQCVEIIYIFV